MKRDLDVLSTSTAPTGQVELCLAAIESSVAFRPSRRHRALLRYLIERTLADDLAALKETMIAVAVFQRPVARFDPKVDSIVRVEARRLRSRIERYYRSEGSGARLRIELPVGSYVPLVRLRDAEPADDAVARRAQDLLERGEHHLRQALSKHSLETAIARFDEALRIAPALPAAFVGLGRAWFNLATGWHHPPRIAADHAVEALERAIEIDATNAIAHALLGAIRHQFGRDWPGAERSFRRAVALAPEQAFVHSAYGAHLYLHGDLRRADDELALARRLDPQYINSRAHMVNLRIAQGRIDDASAELEAMRDVAPESLAANGLAGVIAMARGDAASAVAIYERLCATLPESAGCVACLAGALAASGRLDEADAALDGLRRRFAETEISPYVMALAATHAQRVDEAFRWLERADDERDPSALQIPFDVSFRALHDDPRWPSLVARVRRSATPLPRR